MTDQPEKAAEDPLMTALVDALMTHAAPGGAVDFPKASAAIAQLMAEMIGPNPAEIRHVMIEEFTAAIKRAAMIAGIKHQAAKTMVKQ